MTTIRLMLPSGETEERQVDEVSSEYWIPRPRSGPPAGGLHSPFQIERVVLSRDRFLSAVAHMPVFRESRILP